MLTTERISKNRENVINIIRKYLSNRIGEEKDVDNFILFLDTVNYFNAPASTQYQYSYEGGLCEYSMKVCNILTTINNTMAKQYNTKLYDISTLLIVGLFHNLYKSSLYEATIKNTKVYSAKGSKRDELGRFDWIASKTYAIRTAENREVVSGDYASENYLLLSRYLALSEEEIVVLLNSTNLLENDKTANNSIFETLRRFPLIDYLYNASLLANFVIDKFAKEEQEEDNEESSEEEHE